MKKENKNKKTNLFKLFGVTAMASIMALGAVGVGCSFLPENNVADSNSNVKVEAPAYTADSSIKTEIHNSANLKLFSSEPEVVETESKTYLSYNLKATVYPENAINKELTWFAEFGSDPQGASADEYIQIFVNPEDSSEAEIRVLKPFLGSNSLGDKMYVYCHISDNMSINAECVFNFIGVPTTMNFTGENVTDNALDLTAGTSSVLDIDLTNFFDFVGENYVNFEVTSVDIQGQFNVESKYVTNGTVDETKSFVVGNKEYAPSFAFNWRCANATEDCNVTFNATDFVNVSVDSQKLTVNCLLEESAYNHGWATVRTGYAHRFSSNIEGQDVLVRITVTEKISDCVGYLYVNPVTGATSVSLNQSNIYI
ncbi:MAG: hypothetical protein IKB98_03455 [Clostridia bacterium]|nr:hypothetical protein [Clostridia bacterium]